MGMQFSMQTPHAKSKEMGTSNATKQPQNQSSYIQQKPNQQKRVVMRNNELSNLILGDQSTQSQSAKKMPKSLKNSHLQLNNQSSRDISFDDYGDNKQVTNLLEKQQGRIPFNHVKERQMKTLREANANRPRSKINMPNLSQKLISTTGRSEERMDSRMVSNESSKQFKQVEAFKHMRMPSSKGTRQGQRQAAIKAKSKIITNRNATGVSQTASGANSVKNQTAQIQSTK